MSNKKFRSQSRLNDVERRLEMQRNETLKTADRSSINAAKRHIIWARTFDDGNYPPDPGQSQQEHVLPIIFDDTSYPLVPGPATITRVALDIQRMDYALCSQYYPPGTAVPVFHQNRRWHEVSAASSVTLQKILWAFATLVGGNNCLDPITATNLIYRPFGIFQLPWTDSIGGEGQTWAEGDDIEWADGNQIDWAGPDVTFTVDNPLRICGQDGDLLLLTYQGDNLDPLLVEVFHRCYDIQEIEYDAAQCILGYKDRTVCSPVVSEPTAGPPQPIIDFDNQTFVVDVGYDPSNCSFYNVYQDACVILSGLPSDPLHWLDLRDIQDPCCPCPECPTDCSACPSAYLITLNQWSTPDCGCMNFVQRTLDQGIAPNCLWDTSDNICAVGAFIAAIECINDRWILTMQYSTAGTNDDVDVTADPIDMGPATDCPPTGTYTPTWNYDPTSTVCTTAPTQVVIE